MPGGILFLSTMDFTDKGIQVVKLTPEYFARHGWDVHYAVARDESKNGSYHYQEIVQPAGVAVHRFAMPMCGIGESLNSHILKTVYSKLRGYITVLKLASAGLRITKTNKINVIYGGGPHGVLAAHLVRFFGRKNKFAIVSRFYGILSSERIIKKNILRTILNWDEFLAVTLKSDLLIITNDGTRGNEVVRILAPDNLSRLRFWVNGVDQMPLKSEGIDISRAITICRLEGWKRVDRAISCVARVVKYHGVTHFKYHVVGDGSELPKLRAMVQELGIEENVIFHGALLHEEAIKLLSLCGIYFSTYDLSNVGNPLLEAIRANKVIFTLKNGDTGSWIKHRENGFIYEIDDKLFDQMAADVVQVIESPTLMNSIIEKIKITEKQKLWEWPARMNEELTEIEKLVSS